MIAAAAACAAWSCQSPAPRPEPEQDVARALGVASAVSFRIEGGPIDASPSAADALTLAQAFERAVEHSPELQAALARVRVALAEAEQSRLLPNPVLDFILRFPEGGGRPQIEADLSADLSSLLGRGRRIEAADSRLLAETAAAVSAALDVAQSLQETYASVQALDETLALLAARRATLDRLVALARARLAVGEGTRLDVTTLETQSMELELELADLSAERIERRLALARSIGSPSGAIDWELDDWAPDPELAVDESQWIDAALRRRPELRARAHALAAREAEAGGAGSSIWQGSSLGVDAQREDVLAIGPSLSAPLPIFDLGDARRSRAEAAVVEARHELVSMQRTVIEDVRRSFAAFHATQASLARVRDELVPLQRSRREQVEAIYLAGQVDITAVLLAEQALQQSQARLVELERKAVLSLIRLERAVGGAGVVRETSAAAHRPDDADQPSRGAP